MTFALFINDDESNKKTKTKNKKMKTISKLVATAAMTLASIVPSIAQSDLGAACGCPPVASRPTVDLATLATGGNLNAANTILTCDKTWILTEKIYVGDGQTITINPGTVIKGRVVGAGNAAALVVSRGGKIFATGTESCQIVFTAEADPMDGSYGITNKGQWGGVVILGRAKNNLKVGHTLSASGVDGVGFIEGYLAAEPRNQFGMPVGQEVQDDNSGIMTYVSIRHAGEIVGTNNELNGLTLGSVGRGTTLHHIEVVSNLDDGIEFFGGTVDLKYASVLFNDDDGFDWDLGWSGRGQFWTVIKTDQTTAPGGDNGFESDGDDNKCNCAYLSDPLVYNVTYIGSNDINGVATEKGKAIEAKEQTKGAIYSSIFANYKIGMNLNNDATRPGDDAYDNWINGTFKVECNTFVGNTTLLQVQNAAPQASDLTKFAADGNLEVVSIAGFDFLHTMNTSTNAVTDVYDAIPNPGLASTCTPPVDGFFTPTNYRGAFEAGKKSWLSNYSMNALLDVENGLVACPTDINGDGTTNNIDFLQLLGSFNQSCD